MRRLLLAALIAAAVLVPAAGASQSAAHFLRGTVVAKDRAHRGLVVALANGTVRTVVAPGAFSRTGIGRRVDIRFRPVAGNLPVALAVIAHGTSSHAVVRGTIVRLVNRSVVLSAGGSALTVTLKAPTGKRALASANAHQAKVGDSVKVEVEIDDDGSLDASSVVVTAAPAATAAAGTEGELEVRGKVTVLSPLTVVTGTLVTVACDVPAGVAVNVQVGDLIELKCDLIGGHWTVRAAHGEDGDDDESEGSDDHGAKVEVRGTLAFSADLLTVIVTPPVPGSPVTCAIPKGIVLVPKFQAGDIVKLECVRTGAQALTLQEIEKKGSSSEQGSGEKQGASGTSSGSGESGSNGSDDDDDGGPGADDHDDDDDGGPGSDESGSGGGSGFSEEDEHGSGDGSTASPAPA
jgi:hypothetical protein